MCECSIKCIFRDKCVDFPNSCGSCINNTGKKSYYQPASPFYVPYQPYTNPWWTTNTFICYNSPTSYYHKQE